MESTVQLSAENAIELHPELVKQRQNTYSSLTDLHNIPLFTDEFRVRMETDRQMRKKEEALLRNSTFNQNFIMVQDSDEWLVSQLFAGQQERVLEQEYIQNDTSLSFMDISILLIAVLAVSALYLFVFKDKKVRRTKK